jgi:peptide/nickel transport system ATP-binding protein
MQLPPPTSGTVRISGEDISSQSASGRRQLRRKLQMVFQDPISSLNPRRRIGDIVAESIAIWGGGPDGENRKRVADALNEVGFDAESVWSRRPHEMSGGQCQRVAIARALMQEPTVLVLDEPVSALDVSVQNQILNLLGELQESRGLTYVFISHDLSVVRHISTRICVMFLGKIMEIGPTEEIFGEARHPYTQFLLDSVLPPDPHRRTRELKLLKGEPPSPVNPPTGCRFRTRCPFATELCAAQEPSLRQAGNTQVACHRDVKRGETPFDIMRSPTS